MRWTYRNLDGTHEVEIGEHFEQGGGVEEIFVWCHICDPTGIAVPTFDMRDYPKYRLALGAARDSANKHLRKFQTGS